MAKKTGLQLQKGFGICIGGFGCRLELSFYAIPELSELQHVLIKSIYIGLVFSMWTVFACHPCIGFHNYKINT